MSTPTTYRSTEPKTALTTPLRDELPNISEEIVLPKEYELEIRYGLHFIASRLELNTQEANGLLENLVTVVQGMNRYGLPRLYMGLAFLGSMYFQNNLESVAERAIPVFEQKRDGTWQKQLEDGIEIICKATGITYPNVHQALVGDFFGQSGESTITSVVSEYALTEIGASQTRIGNAPHIVDVKV